MICFGTLCLALRPLSPSSLPHTLFPYACRYQNYPTLYINTSHAGVTDKAVALLVANKIDKYRIAGRPEVSTCHASPTPPHLHHHIRPTNSLPPSPP